MDALSVRVGGGRRVTAYDAGDPSGTPLLFHHGTPSSGKPYAPHVRLAEEHGWRLISFDRAGYGDSTRHAGRTVADVADDTAAVADALGVGRFATWGLSGGGPHALATAALLPERVTAVASVASIAPPDAPGLELTEGMGEGNVAEFGLAREGEHVLRPVLEAEVPGLLAHGVPEFVDALRVHLSDVDERVLSGELGEHVLAGLRSALAHGVDGWVDDDLAFTRPWGFPLGALRVPALVVQGRHDLMVPWAHGEWLARNVPGAEAWLREADGHLTLFVTAAAEIMAWLSRDA